MKRLLTVMLFAVLLMALCAAASAETTGTLPAVGDTTHGFTVSEIGRIDNLGADVVKLTHDRTGARAIFVLNDDPNMGFSICFHTEPSDNTGMLHILEHAVCAASAKYPGRDVFFDAISQGYLTGMNAWTSLSSTNYYITSMDENQLEVLADFYLDCAFDSALLTEPNYFYREGWRYEMPTLEDDLTIAGIVYNEMKGSYGNIGKAAEINRNSVLFPDTYQRLDAGGVPSVIPDLTYDELIAFYKSCYSPANSVTMFYGAVDMDRFLTLLNDGYFSVVDPGEKAVVSAGQAPFDAPVHVTVDFPVAEGAEDTGSWIHYSTVLTEADSADYTNYAIASTVTDLLSDNSTLLMQALNASGIASSYGAYVSQVGTQLVLTLYAEDGDASRDEEFKQIVLTELSNMAEEGFSQDLLHSLFASQELSLRLTRNSGNVAVTLFDTMSWIQEMGVDDSMNAAEWYRKADGLCVPGYAEEKIMAWIVNNPHAALISTVPAPGLLEKNEQALKDVLAEKKASMTDAEKQALVDETAAMSEWIQRETPDETIEKISVVDPANVETKWPQREIATEEIGSVTVVSTPASMDMTAVSLSFDLGHLTDEELCQLSISDSALGGATTGHTQQELTTDLARLTNSLSVQVGAEMDGDSCRPVYTVKWFAPNESVAESVALVFEVLLSTDYTENAELMMQSVDSQISGFRTPETVFGNASLLVGASSSEYAALKYRWNGMPYLADLNAAKEAYAQDADAFVASLVALREKAFQRAGACLTLVGDSDGLAREAILSALDALPENCGETLSREGLSAARRTAIVGSTQASYLMRGIVLENPAQSVSGDILVLNQLLRGEYLLPNLRFQMGAYNASIYLSINGFWTVEYFRGGNVFDADAIIMAMPEFIENLDITQEQLDAYKLPAISALLTPGGELNDALGDILNSRYGFTPEKRLALVEEIRGTTVEDIKALAPAVREMLEKGGLTVITTAGELAGREDEFDAIEQLP